MSKELVALNNLATYLLAPEEESEKRYNYTEIADMLVEIKKALTPPTADEVCEALDKWYIDATGDLLIGSINDFDYDKDEKRFYKRMLNQPYQMTICKIDTNNCIQFREPLSPHIITLIGRFYEGLENV